MVPSPGTESISTVPPASVMMPWTVASPSPVPSPASFVVKNGSKARSRDLRRHARAVVADGQAHARLGPGDADGERAAGGHRVAGVDGEVDEDLLELRTVGQHRHEVGPDGDPQGDPLAQCAVQQPLEVAREDADVEDLGLDDLPAAEHEELARERGGPVGGAPDLVDVVADPRVGRELALGEPHAGQDHGEQVVEVVRDAARELPDGLQALGLREAPLELLARPRRSARARSRRWRSSRRRRSGPPRRAAGTSEQEVVAVLLAARPGDLDEGLAQLAGRDDLAVHLLAPGDPAGRHDLRGAMVQRALGGDPEQLLPAAVDEQVPLLEVLDEDERRGVVDDRLQARLGGPPLGLGPAALGDVDELAEEVQRPLAVAVHERDVHERADDVPVGVHEPALDRVRAAAAREQLLQQRPVEVLVGRVADLGELERADVLLAAAEHLRQRAVQAQPAAVEVDERHADRRVVEGAAEELLGGPQRVLDAPALRDVLGRAAHDRRAALVVEHDLAARVDHPRLLVGPDDPVVQRPAAALGHGRLDDPGHAGAVVLVDLVEVAAVGAGQAVRPHPVDPVELVGPHDVVGGQVPLPAAEPGDLLGLGELGLVGRQPGGLGAAGRDVEDLEDVVERDVARVADGRRADEHDRLRAVGAPQARLALGADLVVAGHALGGPRAALLAPHDHVGQAQAGQLGHVDPEDAPERVVAALDPALDVHDGHAQRRAREGVDEALRVGLLQAGHVAPDGVQETALAVEHGLRLEPAARAVAAHDPEAEALVCAALRELGEARADRVGVLGVDDVEERAAHDLLRGAADELERRRVGQPHHAVDADDGHRVVREGEQARLGRVGRAVRGRRVGHLRPVAGDGRRRTRVEAAPVGVGEPMERPSGATNGRMRAPDGGAGRAGRRAPTRPVGCGAQWPPTHARPMPRPRSRSTS